MKYIYITCLALSSFFNFNPANADTHTNLNAFFIPGGAFQQNTQTIDIEQMKPRYKAPAAPIQEEIDIDEDEDESQITKPAPIKKIANTTPKPKAQINVEKQPSAPSKPKVEQLEKPVKVEAPQKRPTKKYALDDAPLSSITKEEDAPPSSITIILNKKA